MKSKSARQGSSGRARVWLEGITDHFVRQGGWPTILFVLLLTTIALTGGSSRSDALQLLILRPATVLIGLAIVATAPRDLRDVRPILGLLGLFAATIAIQLVPLPPELWQFLPGHERYNAVVNAIGGNDRWRPLSVTPDGTLNALVALLTPLVIIVGFTRLNDEWRKHTLLIVFVIAACSMALGLGQITSDITTFLYFYGTSDNDQLVGLFANRNHHGAFLAATIPLIAAWTAAPGRTLRGRSRTLVGLGACVLVVIYTLVIGSRAGLALALLGSGLAFFVRSREPGAHRILVDRSTLALLAVGSVLTIAVLVGMADRWQALERVVSMTGLKNENRVTTLPTMLRILADAWPFGTGFGSFVAVFAAYEPDAILAPYYFNAAHNDLLEVAITGGIPSVLALLVFFIWWMRAGYRSLTTRHASKSWTQMRRAAFFATAILLLASLVDYPLRTPLLASIFALLCCWMATPDRSRAVSR